LERNGKPLGEYSIFDIQSEMTTKPQNLNKEPYRCVSNQAPARPFTYTSAQKESIMQNKPNFPNTQMNVRLVLIKDYKNFPFQTRRQNKPNQTQFFALFFNSFYLIITAQPSISLFNPRILVKNRPILTISGCLFAQSKYHIDLLMPENDKTYRIFLSAAEPSADAHCAALITALQQTIYNIEFVGIGGPKMAHAGCKLLQTTTGKAAMFLKPLTQIAHYYLLFRRITRFLKTNKVDLVIVCDSPAFNFHIAKAAKKADIKTLFYVAPQLWAWASWRIHKLQKYCDKLCCLLPFEQNWFGQKGIDVTFVGHPLLDELDFDLTRYKKDYTDFQPQNAHFVIIPGSRPAEINTLWLPMQQIALRLKQKYPAAVFTTIAVDSEKELLLKQKQLKTFECTYSIRTVAESAAAVDFAIIASGSATLQVAAAGCPMVIMYQTSRILWYLIGSWLIKTKFLSLVNILADKELVPEFMPYFFSIDPIVESIEQLLAGRDNLARLSSDLIDLTIPLRQTQAPQKVAQVVLEMLD